MAMGDQFDRTGCFLQSLFSFIRNLGDHSEGGESNELFHIFRVLHRVIEILEEKCQPDSKEKAHHGGDKEVTLFIGFIRPHRYFSLVHHLNITGREAG